MSYATLTRKRIHTEVMVPVDITDLAENGWHHDDDCPKKQPLASTPVLADAIASLHRQAHPSQTPDPLTCREEPCRSLSYEELRP